MYSKDFFEINKPYIDGWPYCSSAGNVSTRGEVFTPANFVKSMVDDVLNTIKKDSKNYIDYTVLEPAAGVGHYICTILWHKMECVYQKNKESQEQETKITHQENLLNYQLDTIRALASIYVNDVDPGNIEVIKHRLFKNEEKINFAEKNIISFWQEKISDLLKKKSHKKQVSSYVKTSLNQADQKWATFFAEQQKHLKHHGGILGMLYQKHTGTEAPQWLTKIWLSIMDENFQCFNFISDQDWINHERVYASYTKVKYRFLNKLDKVDNEIQYEFISKGFDEMVRGTLLHNEIKGKWMIEE
jgi:hypothetical protein